MVFSARTHTWQLHGAVRWGPQAERSRFLRQMQLRRHIKSHPKTRRWLALYCPRQWVPTPQRFGRVRSRTSGLTGTVASCQRTSETTLRIRMQSFSMRPSTDSRWRNNSEPPPVLTMIRMGPDNQMTETDVSMFITWHSLAFNWCVALNYSLCVPCTGLLPLAEAWMQVLEVRVWPLLMSACRASGHTLTGSRFGRCIISILKVTDMPPVPFLPSRL